jgi:WD40 repeat protein
VPASSTNHNKRGIAFSPDGHTLASGGSDCTVRLWDISNPRYPHLPVSRNTDIGHELRMKTEFLGKAAAFFASLCHDR